MPSRGRCFRDRRKTKRRLERQQAALAELKRRAPDVKMRTRFGGEIPLVLEGLSMISKQHLVEGYERVRRHG